MLIIAGTIQIEAGHRSAFFKAVAPMVTSSRAEAGCQAYVFSPDVNDAAVIHLYELWDDQEALDLHFASAHMAEWKKASADLPVLGRDIAKYTISEVGGLP